MGCKTIYIVECHNEAGEAEIQVAISANTLDEATKLAKQIETVKLFLEDYGETAIITRISKGPIHLVAYPMQGI
jgi:hypothetical protein